MTTFAEIGLPFPLFEAPISDAAVSGPGGCVVCGSRAEIRFEDACYSCFRAGKTDHTMDTEFGMVRPEDAARGRTHGIPLSPNLLPDLPLVPHQIDPNFPNDHWYSVVFAVEDLTELVRTPGYLAWQGEQ